MGAVALTVVGMTKTDPTDPLSRYAELVARLSERTVAAEEFAALLSCPEGEDATIWAEVSVATRVVPPL